MITLLVIVSLFFSSCSSWFSRSKNKKGTENLPIKTVPKAQYNQLLEKYEALLNQTQRSNVVENIDQESERNEMKNPIIVDSKGISESRENELNGTVDIFQKSKEATVESSSAMDSVTIETQIVQFRKALKLASQKKFNKAFGYLKDLENSKNLQIKVRSKFLIGELLFEQAEYDLAMQIFEEIVRDYAFSGIILKTLDRLVKCCEKLKLSKKREQYYSILHDFFEMG